MTGSDAQPDGQTLYRLLGLTPGVSRERLRHVYEWAVADASRRGDHQGLLMLSQAFDKLPDKNAIYPSASGRTGAGPLPTSASAGSGRPSRRARGNRPRTRRRTAVQRTLAYGVLIPGVVVAVVIAVIRSNADTVPATPIHQQHAVITQVDPSQPSQPVMSASNLPSVPNRSSLIIQPRAVIVVPSTAPTASDGLARILCQPDGTTSGYVEAASRGSKVSCPNGATPRIIG